TMQSQQIGSASASIQSPATTFLIAALISAGVGFTALPIIAADLVRVLPPRPRTRASTRPEARAAKAARPRMRSAGARPRSHRRPRALIGVAPVRDADTGDPSPRYCDKLRR